MSEENKKSEVVEIEVPEGMEIEYKIFKARKAIRESGMTKNGRNDHSKYDYFTPEQISISVAQACESLFLLNLFTLKESEGNYTGVVTVVDLETGSKKDFEMKTFVPDIKSTNASQKIGGTITYSERYLLMTIYDIKDNNLDLDNDGNPKKPNSPKTTQQQAPKPQAVNRALTAAEVKSKWNGNIYKGVVYIENMPIKPPLEQLDKLRKSEKFKSEK